MDRVSQQSTGIADRSLFKSQNRIDRHIEANRVELSFALILEPITIDIPINPHDSRSNSAVPLSISMACFIIEFALSPLFIINYFLSKKISDSFFFLLDKIQSIFHHTFHDLQVSLTTATKRSMNQGKSTGFPTFGYPLGNPALEQCRLLDGREVPCPWNYGASRLRRILQREHLIRAMCLVNGRRDLGGNDPSLYLETKFILLVFWMR